MSPICRVFVGTSAIGLPVRYESNADVIVTRVHLLLRRPPFRYKSMGSSRGRRDVVNAIRLIRAPYVRTFEMRIENANYAAGHVTSLFAENVNIQ